MEARFNETEKKNDNQKRRDRNERKINTASAGKMGRKSGWQVDDYGRRSGTTKHKEENMKKVCSEWRLGQIENEIQ